jgi:hypothetical protein
MNEQQALEPCPFCGGKAEITTRNVEPQGDPWYGRKDETFVLCECGACLFDGSFHEGFYDAETRAVAAWNKRPASSGRSELLEALKEVVVSVEGGGNIVTFSDADTERYRALIQKHTKEQK